jgi:hypothetical protein
MLKLMSGILKGPSLVITNHASDIYKQRTDSGK